MPATIGAPEREEPRFHPRMLKISREHHWSVEQNLFSLCLPHLVIVPILVCIARVPLEPLETGEEVLKNAHVGCI